MPTAEMELKVVTPDGEVWAGQATSVVIPGLDGYFGVWRGHAPLVAGMDIGAVLIKTPEEHVVKFIAVTGGFVEVNQHGVTILAETAELAEDIDVIRALVNATWARSISMSAKCLLRRSRARSSALSTSISNGPR